MLRLWPLLRRVRQLWQQLQHALQDAPHQQQQQQEEVEEEEESTPVAASVQQQLGSA
jgi:hypothetical protein